MNRLVLLALFFFAPAAGAQQPGTEHRDAMKKLEFLSGKWKGDATVLQGPKEALKLTQTEDVQFKLEGVVIAVEGIGRGRRPGMDKEGIVFHAFAVI